MLLLIDSCEPPLPPPDEPRAPRCWPGELLRRSWRLAAGIVMVVLSGAFPPVEAYAVILGGCVLIGRGLATIVGSTTGLREHRQ